jgi:hypothetical protein
MSILEVVPSKPVSDAKDTRTEQVKPSPLVSEALALSAKENGHLPAGRMPKSLLQVDANIPSYLLDRITQGHGDNQFVAFKQEVTAEDVKALQKKLYTDLKYDPKKGIENEKQMEAAYELAKALSARNKATGSKEAEVLFHQISVSLEKSIKGLKGEKLEAANEAKKELGRERGLNAIHLANAAYLPSDKRRLLGVAEASLATSLKLFDVDKDNKTDTKRLEVLVSLGTVKTSLGKFKEAETLLTSYRDTLKESLGDAGKDDQILIAANATLAMAKAAQKKDATADFAEAIRLAKMHDVSAHDVADLYRQLGRNYIQRDKAKDADAAIKALNQGIELLKDERKEDAKANIVSAQLMADRGSIKTALKKFKEAGQDFKEAKEALMADKNIGKDGRGPMGQALAQVLRQSAEFFAATRRGPESATDAFAAERIDRYHTVGRSFREQYEPMLKEAMKTSPSLKAIVDSLKPGPDNVPWAGELYPVLIPNGNVAAYDTGTSEIQIGSALFKDRKAAETLLPQNFAFAATRGTKQRLSELYGGDDPVSFDKWKEIFVKNLGDAHFAQLKVAGELGFKAPVGIAYVNKAGESVTKDLRELMRDKDGKATTDIKKMDDAKTLAAINEYLDKTYLPNAVDGRNKRGQKKTVLTMLEELDYEGNYKYVTDDRIRLFDLNRKILKQKHLLRKGDKQSGDEL